MTKVKSQGNEAAAQCIACYLKRGGDLNDICEALNISDRALKKKRYQEDGAKFSADEAAIISRITQCTILADQLDRDLNRIAVTRHSIDISIDDDGTEHVSVQGVCDLATSAETGHSDLIKELIHSVSNGEISRENMKAVRKRMRPLIELLLRYDKAMEIELNKKRP